MVDTHFTVCYSNYITNERIVNQPYCSIFERNVKLDKRCPTARHWFIFSLYFLSSGLRFKRKRKIRNETGIFHYPSLSVRLLNLEWEKL
jgi:hypothetical protein